MFSEIFSLIYGTILFLVDLGVMLFKFARAVPPLMTDLGMLLGGGLYFTRLAQPPGGRADLPGPGVCVAHRGAYLDAPENSMAAFKYCVEKGCKYVEFDVRTCQDGQCVVWHDSSAAGVDLATADWSRLHEVILPHRHPAEEKFGLVHLCLLEEVADFLEASGVHMVVDLKEADSRTCASVARLFTQRPGLLRTSIITSFSPLAIYKVRRLEPRITAALTYQPDFFSIIRYSATGEMRYRFKQHSPLKHYCARVLDVLYTMLWSTGLPQYWVGCSALLLHKDIVSPEVMSTWRNKGYSVIVWPANLPLDKHYAGRALGVAYLTDTLVGEHFPVEDNAAQQNNAQSYS